MRGLYANKHMQAFFPIAGFCFGNPRTFPRKPRTFSEKTRASERAKSGLGRKSLVQSESPFAVNGHDPNSSDKVTLKSRVTPGETKQ